MFQLDDILEQWATIYTPLSHDPGAATKPKDRAFFRIDRLDQENEWTRNENLIQHPCLLFSTAVEAQLSQQNPKRIERPYDMYLAVPQRSVNNAQQTGIEATRCKRQLDQMACDLVAFLFDLQDYCSNSSWPHRDTPPDVRQIGEHLDREQRQQVRGLRMEQTQWWSTPLAFGRWWLLGLELSGLDPRPLCIVPSRYRSFAAEPEPTATGNQP